MQHGPGLCLLTGVAASAGLQGSGSSGRTPSGGADEAQQVNEVLEVQTCACSVVCSSQRVRQWRHGPSFIFRLQQHP